MAINGALIRSTVAPLIGGYTFLHEVQTPGERPYLLFLAVIMMLAPAGDLADYLLRRRADNGKGQ